MMALAKTLLLIVAGALLAGPASAAASLSEFPDMDDDVGIDEDLEMAPQVAMAAAFTFKAAIETSQPRLFLGDLASCSGMREICSEAYAIDLGPSPEPGRQMIWRADKLQAIFATEWPKAHIELRLPKVVKISAASAGLAESRIFNELRDALARQLPSGPLAVSVERVIQLGQIKVRPGDVSLSFPDLTPEHLQDAAWVRKNLNGVQRLTVACRAMEAGPEEGTQTFVVSAQFAAREEHLVARQHLRKGTLLAPADLAKEWLTAPRQAGRPSPLPEQVLGQRLKRELQPGAQLGLADVEPAKLLKRGQLATLLLRRGDLNVTSQVKVLTDASAGQTVEAMYPSTKKKLRVQAVDTHTVQLAY